MDSKPTLAGSGVTPDAPTQAPAVAPTQAKTAQPVSTSVFAKTAPVVAAPGIAASVNKVQGATLPVPKGLKKFNTRDTAAKYFHAIVYGETDARKTTTAATFGDPAKVRIIMTRREEQLLPLQAQGYEAAKCEDAESFIYACMYPERLWPEWAALPDRVLVIDDITAAKDMLLDENSTNDEGKELKDNRKIHVGAKKDMQATMRSVLAKPQHVIVVALAKVYANDITNEETIGPDLPPAMLNMVTTDFEFVFYIKKGVYKLLTEEDRTAFQKKDDKGVLKGYVRKIFGKHKLPKALEGTGVIKKEEEMNLIAIWERVQKAIQGTGAAGGGK